MERLATLSDTLEGMQKWVKVVEGAGTDSEGKTPLDVFFEEAKKRGPKVFAKDLLENVDYTHLLMEVRAAGTFRREGNRSSLPC